jgi:hypothetical protein
MPNHEMAALSFKAGLLVFQVLVKDTSGNPLPPRYRPVVWTSAIRMIIECDV